MKTTIEKREFVAESYIVRFAEKNRKNEMMEMWVTRCENHGGHNSLPNIWHRHGYTESILPNYWTVETFCYDENGNCFGLYNPQHKLHESGGRYVINFDYMLEATEANRDILINAVVKLFEN